MAHPPEQSLHFLERLIEARGPSGFEAHVQACWMDYVTPLADSMQSDSYGNCWASLIVDPSFPTVVMTGHADEIGLMINHIEPSGLLRIVAIGGVDPAILPGRRVLVQTDTETIPGVVGAVPIHLLEQKGERKTPTIDKLFIDCGFRDDKDASKRVRVGNTATVAYKMERLGESRIVSRATDNRIGIFSAADAFRRLAEQRNKLNVNIIALSTVQEEIGLCGAQFATRQIQPDIAFVIDVTHATDIPGVEQAKHGKVLMGEGPTVTHGTSNHPGLVQHMMRIADARKIPIQHEASSRYTGTDTDAIYKATTGIPSALISLPNRYMHTPSEVVDLEDLEQLLLLLTESVLALDKSSNFSSMVAP